MNLPPDRHWQQMLQNLKIGFDKSPSPESLNQIEVDSKTFFGWERWKHRYIDVLKWFGDMSSTGKLLAVVITCLLIFTLLKTVFQILSSLITIGVVIIIFYAVYRVLIEPKRIE
jgi:type IV secretory pathway VirB6-like protein